MASKTNGRATASRKTAKASKAKTSKAKTSKAKTSKASKAKAKTAKANKVAAARDIAILRAYKAARVRKAFAALGSGLLALRSQTATLTDVLVAAWPIKTAQPWASRLKIATVYVATTGKAPGAFADMDQAERERYNRVAYCVRSANDELARRGKLTAKPAPKVVAGRDAAARQRKPGKMEMAAPALAKAITAKQPNAHDIALKIAGMLKGADILRKVARELETMANAREDANARDAA